MKGKIIKGIGGFYYVKTSDGEVFECRARGIFRKSNIKPCVGDDVEISVQNESGSIDEIYERKSILVRPPVSNIDVLVIVMAAAEPSPDTFLTDKLIVNAEIAGIKPVICINKSDLKNAEEISEIYKKAGYDSLCITAKEPDETKRLLPYLENRISAFAGLSGVGKSTVLGILTGEIRETGSISKKIKRGRHTTREVELLELECGGYVLDTPGFSSFEVTPVKADELQSYFPEMRNMTEKCRFKGCSHINEPDCEVKRLVQKGEIAKSRYESYKVLYEKLKNIKEWEN